LRHAEELLGMSARMREAVSDRAAYGGFIAVGVIEAVVLTWLPELLVALQRQFPKVRVEIHQYTSTYLHEELLRGNLDLALTVEAIANPAIENSSICGFQMGWIIAPSARGDPPLSDVELLDRLPILTFLRNSLVYRDVVAKLGPYCVGRINPMSSIAAVVALVRAGYGIATLPVAAIASAVESGALIGLRAGPELSPQPVVASRRRASESPLVEAAVQLAIEAARVYASASRPGVVVLDDNHI